MRNEVARHHPLADTRARSRRPGRRARHRLNPAYPALSQVSVLVRERSVVFPTYAEIETQPGTGFEIVLEVSAAACRIVAVDNALGCAACAEQALVDVAGLSRRGVLGSANQQIVKAPECKVPASSGPDDRPVISFLFETGAHRVTAAGNGDLIGDLRLVGHAKGAIVDTAQNSKAAC